MKDSGLTLKGHKGTFLDYEIVICYDCGGDFLNKTGAKEKKKKRKLVVTILTSNKIDFKAGNTMGQKKDISL